MRVVLSGAMCSTGVIFNGSDVFSGSRMFKQETVTQAQDIQIRALKKGSIGIRWVFNV